MFILKLRPKTYIEALIWNGENIEDFNTFFNHKYPLTVSEKGELIFTSEYLGTSLIPIGNYIVKHENGSMTSISEEKLLNHYDIIN